MKDAEDHLDNMQDSIDGGIGASNQAKSDEDLKNSPAGRHLQDSKDALFEWETSDLASSVAAASEAAHAAADAGEKAAEIYKEIMSGNQLSIGEIHGSTKWDKGEDLKFDLEIIFGFILKIDLKLFKIDINFGGIKICD